MDDTSPPRIVFADDAIVVIDKPSGMPSVPARTPLDPPAVAVRLAAEFGQVEAVHRLDRDTSGLLVLARTRDARVALGIAFEKRLVSKRYLAVVVGEPSEPAGLIDLPLARDPDQPPRHRVDHDLGRPATTVWQRLAKHVGDEGVQGTSLMDLEPLTGRSHQLRVHLASMGCPIMGDRLYGVPPWNEACPLALHATRLAFDHPMTGEPVVFQAPPPMSYPWSTFSVATTSPLPSSVAGPCIENVRPHPAV
jgi:tRNA pseudouridine32 synthase/23S rRNA pseudouridine746 synthase